MQDLTTGPIGMTLITFALPVLGSNILQSLNGSANAIWVSHVLGEAALTATVNANNIFFLMLGAVFGMTMAANLLISQSVGAGNLAMVKRVVDSAVGGAKAVERDSLALLVGFGAGLSYAAQVVTLP